MGQQYDNTLSLSSPFLVSAELNVDFVTFYGKEILDKWPLMLLC